MAVQAEHLYSMKAVLGADTGLFAGGRILPLHHKRLSFPSSVLFPNAVRPHGKIRKDTMFASLPTIQGLRESQENVMREDCNAGARIAWCQDVLFLVDLDHHFASPLGINCEKIIIKDEQLAALVSVAIPLILGIANTKGMPMSRLSVAKARYARATLSSTGVFPDYVAKNPRAAFRDFEAAAKGGYHDAWFRIGRVYENFDDPKRARTCFERGAKRGSGGCAYVSNLSL